MASWITVTDAKTELNIPNANSDGELQGFVDAACAIVEGEVGPVATTVITGELVELQGRTVFNELTTAGPREFVLRHRPVQSIQAITSAIVSGTTYTVADFVIDCPTGIIRRADWGTIYGPLTVDYTVGYTTPPAWAVMAAKIITLALWQSQRGGARRPGSNGAGLDVPTMGGDIPAAAAMLLRPHQMVPAIG